MIFRFLFARLIYVHIEKSLVNDIEWLLSDFKKSRNILNRKFSDIQIYKKPYDNAYYCSYSIFQTLKFKNKHFNQSFIDQNSDKVYFIQSSYNALCFRVIPKLLAYYKMLIPLMIIIFILRITLSCVPIKGVIPVSKNFVIAYSDKFGNIYASSSGYVNFIDFNAKEHIKDCVDCNLNMDRKCYRKIITRYSGCGVWETTYITEEIQPWSLSFDGKCGDIHVNIDDHDTPQITTGEYYFGDDYKPSLIIPFDLHSETCFLTLTTDDRNVLDKYLAPAFEIQRLHMSLFLDGIPLKSSQENFVALMKEYIDRMEYDVVCISAYEEGSIHKVVDFTPSGYEHDITDLLNEAFSKVGDYVSGHCIRKNVRDLHVRLSLFYVENITYAILIGVSSSSCVARSSERYLHIFISLLVYYHHTSLKKWGEISLLNKITNIWKNLQGFVYMECIDDPFNLSRVFGNLFGKPADSDIANALKHVSKHIQLDSEEKEDMFQEYSYEIVHNKTTHWISVHLYAFTLHNHKLYNYFIEDVTELYQNSYISSPESSLILFTSAFLGVNKMSKESLPQDMVESLYSEIENMTSTQSYSNYTVPPRTLSSNFRLAKILKNNDNHNLVLILPDENNNFYYSFANSLKDSLPFIINRLWERPSDEIGGQIKLFMCDIKNDSFFEKSSKKSLYFSDEIVLPDILEKLIKSAPAIKSFISEFYKQDRDMVIQKIMHAIEANKISFTARYDSEVEFDWVICNIQYTDNILTFFVFSVSRYNFIASSSIEVSLSLDHEGSVFFWKYDPETDERGKKFTDVPYSKEDKSFVFNLSSYKQYVLPYFFPIVENAFKSKKVDIIIQMRFKSVGWFHLKGQISYSGILNGIAVMIPNESTPPVYAFDKLKKKIRMLENSILKLKEKKPSLDISSFKEKLSLIKKDYLE